MSVDDTRRDPAPSHDPDDSAHADSCLDCAIARVKRHLGVETEQAQIIASLLPEHLQRPFWERMVETYLDREVERLSRCATCGSDDVKVVICDHIANGDAPERVRTIEGGPQDLVRHDCGDPHCPDRVLCGGCWSDL